MVSNSQPLRSIWQQWQPIVWNIPKHSKHQILVFFLHLDHFFSVSLTYSCSSSYLWNITEIFPFFFALNQNDSISLFSVIFSWQMADDPWFDISKSISPGRIRHSGLLRGRYDCPEGPEVWKHIPRSWSDKHITRQENHKTMFLVSIGAEILGKV